MDPLSHAIVGGVAATSLCRDSKMLRLAAASGMIAGMPPDLDVLIRSADNPMLALRFHRHFTHSLAFSPLGTVIVAALLWLGVRQSICLARTIFIP